MSLVAVRCNGTLDLIWPVELSKNQVKKHKTVFVVKIRDEVSGRQWVTTPLHGSVSPLSVAVPELLSCPDHRFDVQVVRCQRFPGSVNCRAKESLKATVHEDVSGMFARSLNLKSDRPITGLRQLPQVFSFEDFSVKVQRKNSCQVMVCWRNNGPQPDMWQITLMRIGSLKDAHLGSETAYFFAEGDECELELPVRLSPGANYKVSVCGMQSPYDDDNIPTYQTFYDGTAYFKAGLTYEDLESLYDVAIAYCGNKVEQCVWLYRNKSQEYFNKIFCQDGWIMRTYPKDNSGDPGSCINGNVNGLFFMSKNINGQPPADSQFGPCRLQVPTEVLFGLAPNLYFADFYCMRGQTHYVTLVMTRPGSKADTFCSSRLLPLNLANNPFLHRKSNGLFYVSKQSNFLVELLYTEDINVAEMLTFRGAVFTESQVVCKGSSTPGGIPKNPDCKICNVGLMDDSFELPSF